tara:strand:+ start:813 stop:1271 length:459 start_codon:yes stop_codon:yes gene_type:complete
MKSSTIIKLISLAIIGVFFGTTIGMFFIPMDMHHAMMDIDGKRDSFISLADDIQGHHMPHGDYRCCLEKPCIYCIIKTPGHGEKAKCDCLGDVVNGVHPCGECIGEIMEGHGNPFLANYFAKAIAEKVGMHHIGELRLIILDMYGIPIEDQL